MTTALQNLGTVVRSFRIDAGLTQRELAAAIHPQTSRSTIAHVEHGELLPTPQVLSAICKHLRIPSSVWEPFLGRAYRLQATIEEASSEVLPQFIAVSGVNGSGKTTLVSQLAEILGYARLPEALPGLAYLGDLAVDPRRWAFETQLAFLSHKATQLRTLLDRGARVIVDRSLSEDVNIFAEYWYSRGDISERAYTTYLVLARHFHDILPPPDLLIYCNCSADTSIARVHSRRRNDPLHTEDRLRDQHARYQRWHATYSDGEMATVDTEKHDFRDSQTIRAIANEIRCLYRSRAPRTYQLSLFDLDGAAASFDPVQPPIILQPASPQRYDTEGQHSTTDASPRLQSSPILAYLAAPFTSVASSAKREANATLSLFPEGNDHGVIERGPYRNALLSIERALQGYGIRTWIPHRDTNAWGRRIMTPAQVAYECTVQVRASDLLVGVLSTSMGAHYEVGLARGFGRPVVLLACDDMAPSFIGRGLEYGDWPDTLLLRADRLRVVSKQFHSASFRSFITRYFPVHIDQ